MNPVARPRDTSARQQSYPTDTQLAVGVAAVTFLVYLLTLSRGVLGGDSGELQFVPPILGLTHPTGYPLQVLVHFAWSHLPFASVAYGLNLLDALLAAAAVGCVVAVTRALGTGRAGAVVAGLSLAFGELWWSQAVRGDKYTLNGLFLAVVLLLFLRWRAGPSEGRFAALALAYGLSLTHHRSMLLVAPALAVGVLLARWRPASWRGAMLPVVLALVPLLLYAYVPWAGARGLPPGSWPVGTPGEFVEFLLDRGYTSQLRPDAAFRGRLLEEGAVLLRSFGPLGVALGALGAGVAWARGWQTGLVLLLTLLPQAVLGASYLLESNYQLPRHWVFFLPAFLIWSVWLGLGYDAIVGWVVRRLGSRQMVAGAGILAAVLLVQAGSAWARGAIMLVRTEAGAETMDAWRQDFQRSPVAERFGRLAFELARPNATIVCDWEQATVLWYLQRVEGQRPDLTIVYPIERLDEAMAAASVTDSTVYISRTLPGVEGRYITSSHGPLVRVSSPPPVGAGGQPGQTGWPGSLGPEPYEPQAREVFTEFDGGLGMTSIAVHTPRPQPGSVLAFTIYWHAQQPLMEDFAASVRLVGPDGTVLAQQDERHPALGTSPSSRWPVQAPIGDYRELPIGSRLRPGIYQVQIVPYRVEPRQPLAVQGIVPVPGQILTTAPEGVAMTITVEPRTSPSPLDLLASLMAR
jgi:hypothetical protein